MDGSSQKRMKFNENMLGNVVAFLLAVPSEARDMLLGSLWEGQRPHRARKR